MSYVAFATRKNREASAYYAGRIAEMAAWEQRKGNSVSAMSCGKAVMGAAVCSAMVTWPAKPPTCGATVSPQ